MDQDRSEEPDLLAEKRDVEYTRFSSPSRVHDIEWPATEYIETIPLPWAAQSVRIKFMAADQGWGNTGFCWVGLIIVSADGLVEQHRLLTLTHIITEIDHFVHEDVLARCRKGSILKIVSVSAPWQGFVSRISYGCICVWYRKQRYEMAVIRALLDKYSTHAVAMQFQPTSVDSSASPLESTASAIGGMLSSVCQQLVGTSPAVERSMRDDENICRALSFLFGKCDGLVFSIIVRFAFE